MGRFVKTLFLPFPCTHCKQSAFLPEKRTGNITLSQSQSTKNIAGGNLISKYTLIWLFVSIFSWSFSQQPAAISGKVIDNNSRKPIPQVRVALQGTALERLTDADGIFSFAEIIPGNYILHIETTGYLPIEIPVQAKEDSNLETIPLERDLTQEQTDNLITLTETELNDDESTATVTSGLLQASRDVFSTIAAFQFGQTFFRVRGLDSQHGAVLLNGMPMNQMRNGSPSWSSWSGLNDVTRNQEVTPYSAPSDYAFGGLSGTAYISTRASGYSPGIRLSAAASNRSYTGRLMATYHSGLRNNTYAYSLSVSRRWAQEGFTDGTLYDAYSLFGAVEYTINPNQSLNLTLIYAPVRRGKASANTQEVTDLKGIRYNSYWGYQNGEIRNARVRNTHEPLYLLSHYWNVNDTSTLQTNLAYQAGSIGNSRLEFGGATALTTTGGSIYYSGGTVNPDPVYYQKLPSFYLSFDDEVNYQEVYNRTQEFITNGQINWAELYASNLTNTMAGRNASYILYEDRNDDRQYTANSIFKTQLSENITFHTAATYRRLHSKNFANVLDLLGGTGYLDVTIFTEDPSQAPNDLLHPNRIVGLGDAFQYNYNLYAQEMGGFAQATFRYNKVDFYASGTLGKTGYQREGWYQNGLFPDNSLGKGKKIWFNTYGVKLGATYKLTGNHFVDINALYLQNAPTLQNTFSNPRQNHDIVPGISEPKVKAIDMSYIIRAPLLKSRLTGYYSYTADVTEISSFFADGIGGDTSAFVQEVLTGVEKQNLGLEWGIDLQVTPSIALKGAAALGEFIYNNNPKLYLTSADFIDVPAHTAQLKNYKIAGGPQRAFSAGFEYRDPDFWWVNTFVNYFSNTFIDISPLARTANFYSDADGLPFPEYDETIARGLLRQEKFPAYFLVNLAGGKSWRVHDYSIGFFASINNLLNQLYKTGGFEQARNANYRQMLEEHQNPIPVFGPRYWYGTGTNYFINMYVRF